MTQPSNFQSGAKPQRTVEDKENVTSVSTSIPVPISMTSQTLTSTSPFRVSSGPFPASVDIFILLLIYVILQKPYYSFCFRDFQHFNITAVVVHRETFMAIQLCKCLVLSAQSIILREAINCVLFQLEIVQVHQTLAPYRLLLALEHLHPAPI